MIPDAVRVVFFDAGGTLLHPYPSVGKIYGEVASRYGCHVEEGRIEKVFRKIWVSRDGLALLESHSNEKVEREWWKGVVREVFSHFGGVRDFEVFFGELYEVFGRPESWRLYPEVPEVLGVLKGRGKRLGIISNWDSRLFQLCTGLGLGRFFDFVLASAVIGASKPSPRIFQEALQRAGVSADFAIHVGDSFEDDVTGASRSGIAPVLIDRRNERGKVMEDQSGVLVIRDLRELLS